jgi:hypothetical protein
MITALLATLALLTPPTACRTGGCSCVRLAPVNASTIDYEAIFEGHVLQVRDTTIWRTEGPRLLHVRRIWHVVTFRVYRVWKGRPDEIVQVLTDLPDSTCGYLFKEGEQYVVFAERSDPWLAPRGGGPLVTDICSHTTQARKAAAIRDSLGPPVSERS